MHSKPSIKDIARMADVSIGTVDRVLHNRGQVSEATKRKVQKVIDKMGYEPNRLASSLASKRNYRIGVLLPFSSNKNEYWYYPAIGIQKAVDENQLFGVDVVKAYYDINSLKSFQKKIPYLLNSGVDGIITAPVFKQEVESFTQLLDEKSIKYVLLDSDLEHSNRSFFVGQNPFKAGRVAAQLLNFTIEDITQTEIAILHFNPVNQVNPTAKWRKKGFVDYFEEKSAEEYVHVHSISFTSEAELERKLSQLFGSYQNLKAIFVPDSKSYILADYLEQQAKKDCKVVGFDLLENNVAQLKNGNIDFLIHQQPVTQGYEAFRFLLELLAQPGKRTKTQNIPVNIISSENIDAVEVFEES